MGEFILDQQSKAIIRALQEDLPLVARPYKEIADRLNISEQALLEKMNFLLQEGIIRKIGAVLNHRKAGFSFNAMVAWKVEEGSIDSLGTLLSTRPQISHCYHRETSASWPYNLFTMIHGKKQEACENIILAIAQETGITEYQVLYSANELKKISMRYFETE